MNTYFLGTLHIWQLLEKKNTLSGHEFIGKCRVPLTIRFVDKSIVQEVYILISFLSDAYYTLISTSHFSSLQIRISVESVTRQVPTHHLLTSYDISTLPGSHMLESVPIELK